MFELDQMKNENDKMKLEKKYMFDMSFINSQVIKLNSG